MSFISIEYLSDSSGGTPIVELIVSSVKDAFITGNVLDNANGVIAWRIKDLKGGLKFNYGWAPETEWKKYKQVFFPESIGMFKDNPSTTTKPGRFITKTETSHDPHAR
jgi:hypothetical protein